MRLPNLNASRIDELRRVTLRRREQPTDERLQLLRFVLLEALHDIVIVPHQQVDPFVDARRVVELFVSVTCPEWRDRGVEGGRVTEARILVARGERTRHTSHRAAVRELRAMNQLGLPLLLGPHLARDVDLRPGDMTVHVDPARHDHQPRGVDHTRRPYRRIGRSINDPPIEDPDVPHLAIDPIGRVVNSALRNFNVVG